MAIISKLLAISSLLVLSASAIDSNAHLGARGVGHHAALAKRRIDVATPVSKRGMKKRCRARPSDTPAPPPADNNNGGGSGGNNGGSGDNNGGSTGGNNGGSTGGDTGGNTGGSTGGNTGGGNTGGNTGGGSAGGVNASGKRGMAWPNGPWDLDKWKGHKASWLYTWSPDCPDNAASLGFECVPMLWGYHQESDFVRLTNQDGYAHNALFVNEPNQHDQSNMDVGGAIALWRRAFQPLKARGYRLGSAAPTSAPNGKTWLQDFKNGCPDCTVDFLALHYYDTTTEGFINYMTDFHNTFGLNIWVTEVACQSFVGGAQCDMGQIYNFIGTLLDWMDSTPWIERYSFFGTMRDMTNVNTLNRMMNDDGTPNDLGWFYLDH